MKATLDFNFEDEFEYDKFIRIIHCDDIYSSAWNIMNILRDRNKGYKTDKECVDSIEEIINDIDFTYYR